MLPATDEKIKSSQVEVKKETPADVKNTLIKQQEIEVEDKAAMDK